jgi:spore coat protein U-like protein
MKKLLGVVMVLGLVLVLGRVAMAADTNTLTVQANVIGTCKFSTATSTLGFGALDPSSSSGASASTTVDFWCTKNATYTITAGNGAHYLAPNRRMQHATIPTEFIPYSLTPSPTSGSGSGKTTPITLTLNGSIANVDYVNANVGNYSDTVALSITP